MTVKMTGTQFKAFWNSEWIPGRPNVAVDDWVYQVNGRMIGSDDDSDFNENDVDDTAAVRILQGCVYDQDDTQWPGMELHALARRWLRLQDHVHLIVEVRKDQVQSLKALLESAKVKVLTR